VRGALPRGLTAPAAAAAPVPRPPPRPPRHYLSRLRLGVHWPARTVLFGAVLAWLVPGLAAGAWALWRAPLQELRLEGRRALAAEDVLRLTGLQAGLAMHAVDPFQTAQRLRAHPRVVAADVRRVYPGRVDVRLVERTAELRVLLADGRTALVDRDDVVLDLLPRGTAPTGAAAALPLVATAARTVEPSRPLRDPGLGRARAALVALRELGFADADRAAVDAGDPFLLRMRLAGGARLILTPDRLEPALRAYREVSERYPTVFRQGGAVDLTTLDPEGGGRIVIRAG
jgi:hypothetical protein